MLTINPNPTFKADVEITVPGQKEPGTISLTFKYMSRKEFTAHLEMNKEKKDKSGKVTQKGKTTSEDFPSFVLGWGLEEEFNQENIEIFLDNYPASYLEIWKQYTNLLFESRIKN